MTSGLGRAEQISLLSLTAACVGVLINTFEGEGEPLIASLAFSGIGFASSYCLIRWLGKAFMKAGFKGRDMAKTRNVEMYVSQHVTIIRQMELSVS